MLSVPFKRFPRGLFLFKLRDVDLSEGILIDAPFSTLKILHVVA